MTQTLSLVIPAYNEEHRVGRLLDGLRELSAAGVPGLRLLEAVIVDDGSTDATAAAVQAELPGAPWIRLISDGTPNRGKGAATGRGVAAARGELVLLTDVDLATPLHEVAKLHAVLGGGVDVAIGSRDVPGSVVTGASFHRKLMGRIFNYGVRRMTGLPFRDTQCGFKLMGTAAGRRLLGEQLVAGYAFDVELLLRARALGLRVAEVPIRWEHRPGSKLNPLPAAVSMSVDVLRLVRAARRTDPDLAHEPCGP
ncbi:MAG: glycosyltransferase [Solirubrobacteraceae bacterium]